jgi:hypothetical protein
MSFRSISWGVQGSEAKGRRRVYNVGEMVEHEVMMKVYD